MIAIQYLLVGEFRVYIPTMIIRDYQLQKKGAETY